MLTKILTETKRPNDFLISRASCDKTMNGIFQGLFTCLQIVIKYIIFVDSNARSTGQ